MTSVVEMLDIADSQAAARDVELMLADKSFEIVALQGIVAEQEVRIAELEDHKPDTQRTQARKQEERIAELEKQSKQAHDHVAWLVAENHNLEEQLRAAAQQPTENDKVNRQTATAHGTGRDSTSATKNLLIQLAAAEAKMVLLEADLAAKDMELSQVGGLYNKLLTASEHIEIKNKEATDDSPVSSTIHASPTTSTIDDSDSQRSQDRSVDLTDVSETRGQEFGFACSPALSDDPLISVLGLQERHVPLVRGGVRCASPMRIVTELRAVNGKPTVWARGRVETNLAPPSMHDSHGIAGRTTTAPPMRRPFQSASPVRRCSSPMQSWRSTHTTHEAASQLAPHVRWLAPSPMRALPCVQRAAQFSTPAPPLSERPIGRTLWTETRVASPARACGWQHTAASPAVRTMAASPMRTMAASPVRTMAASPVRAMAPSRVRTMAASPTRTMATSPVRTMAASPIRSVAASPVRTTAISPVRTMASSPVRTMAPRQISVKTLLAACAQTSQRLASISQGSDAFSLVQEYASALPLQEAVEVLRGEVWERPPTDPLAAALRMPSVPFGDMAAGLSTQTGCPTDTPLILALQPEGPLATQRSESANTMTPRTARFDGRFDMSRQAVCPPNERVF